MTNLKLFRYVKLKYRPIRNLQKMQSRLMVETNDLENNDFVELILYNKDEGVLMTGKMTDGDENFVKLHLKLNIVTLI